MARPQKEGMDYFPLDVDIDQDDKVALIEAKHGMIGFSIVIKLLMKIYKEGYYYQWTEREQLLFSSKINVDINTVNEVVDDCIKWGFFEKEIFEKYQVLTSNGIQKRYIEAAKRRKSITMISEYALINPSEYLEKISILLVNYYNNPVNVDNNSINNNINPQSKVKKRKVKESKLNYAEFVKLASEEYEKLVSEYGEEDTKRMIEILDNYKGSSGKKYKDDYRAIKNWVIKRVQEEKGKSPPTNPKKEMIRGLYNL